MGALSDVVDFDVIEQQKENIEPLKEGRSALALKELFNLPHEQMKIQQMEQRNKIELQLKEIDELDDPIQPYLDYLHWITENYPSGRSVESGLIQVLERCTSEFRDAAYYKNDPRYLKVWLTYAKYSENPRDIFVYLARKEIGKSLATYYEEFANYLEVNDRNLQADQVYKEGIKQNARPLQRLQKRYNEFQVRLENKNSLSNEPQSPVFPTRSALSIKQGVSLFSTHDDASSSHLKKRKLEVFNDSGDSQLSSDIKAGGWDNLGSGLDRNKENRLEAKPWAGETLKQTVGTALGPKLNKVSVFKDDSHNTMSGPVYKIIEVPGKRPEKVDLNFDLLYQQNEEYCIQEVFAMMRNTYKPDARTENKQKLTSSSTSPKFKTLVREKRKARLDETIHLSLTDLKKKPSPTATFYTKEAKDEIYSMFNQNAEDKPAEKEEEEEEDDIDELIYDDYTEQFTRNLKLDLTERVGQPKHEITEEQDLLHLASKECVINPSDENLKEMLLQDLNPPLNSYKGFYKYPKEMTMCSTLKKSLNTKQSKHVFFEFEGTRNPFNLKALLGEGGFASVYLAESMTGEFKAIKAQKPSSAWEFYILKQISDRLKGNKILESIVVQNEIHLYTDESYLVLDYIQKGTVLDIVNLYRSEGRNVDESLVIFLAVELIKVIEALHRIGIMHGDLKPDNCMLRFESIDGSWESKGIKLIDFGRSIDMTLFPRNVQFRCNWKTDNQDCPEMRNKETWTYQADYYGIASIIHTLLFGSFIETTKDGNKYRLMNSIKRYWQQDLWNGLFDLLINSRNYGELPLTSLLQEHREKLEQWLHENSSNLDTILKDIEMGLK